MTHRFSLHYSALTLALAPLFYAPHAIAAANFTIVPTPGTLIPSSIYPGSSIFAYYTVTNNTSSTRQGYIIQGLPSFVTQEITTNPTYCQNPITLAAHASCVLMFNIPKPVESSFALCKGSSCTTASMPLRVRQSSFVAPLLANGYYFNSTNNYPLLASSQDAGITWSYSIYKDTPALPSDFINGRFSDLFKMTASVLASCSGLNCVAAGIYFSSNNTYPLLANSKNGGATWTYSIDSSTPALPQDFKNGVFSGASCSGLSCVAAGTYSDNSSNSYPLLANSRDGGAIWTYSIDSHTPALPQNFTAGSFNSASCSGLSCVAVGYYVDTSYYYSYPLLANSTDGGVTWTYSIDANTPTLPQNFSLGSFISASCSGLSCVAAGTYTDSSYNQYQYPLLANSKDGGVTWTYPIDGNTPALPQDFNQGSFSGTSCSGLNCVAAGSYADSSYNTYPLLANSTDGGITWTYSIDSSAPTLPQNFNLGSFSAVSCSGLNCVAAGSYFDSSYNSYPLLANSLDGGVTWTYSIDSSTPALPQDFNNGIFSGASCSGLSCVAAGTYTDSSSISYPLLANSKDGGVTWTYSIDSNAPALPPGFSRGSFSGAGGSSLLPSSLSFLKELPERPITKINQFTKS